MRKRALGGLVVIGCLVCLLLFLLQRERREMDLPPREVAGSVPDLKSSSSPDGAPKHVEAPSAEGEAREQVGPGSKPFEPTSISGNLVELAKQMELPASAEAAIRKATWEFTAEVGAFEASIAMISRTPEGGARFGIEPYTNETPGLTAKFFSLLNHNLRSVEGIDHVKVDRLVSTAQSQQYLAGLGKWYQEIDIEPLPTSSGYQVTHTYLTADSKAWSTDVSRFASATGTRYTPFFSRAQRSLP